MGFFEGFLLGRATANNKKRNGGGLVANVLFLILLFTAYKWFEKFTIMKFSGYFLEISISYILISILLYRYNYNAGRRSINIDLIGFVLNGVNIVLCAIFGFVFFRKVGNTPFNFLIEFSNVLNWGTHNSFIEIMGEIIYLILKILDILIKPLAFMLIQQIVLKKAWNLKSNLNI